MAFRPGLLHGTPGLTTTKSNLPACGVEAPNLTSAPSFRSSSASRRKISVSALSSATTVAPRRRSRAVAADPLAPRPRTRTFLFSTETISTGLLSNLQRAQCYQATQNSEDVKPHNDLRFVPAF